MRITTALLAAAAALPLFACEFLPCDRFGETACVGETSIVNGTEPPEPECPAIDAPWGPCGDGVGTPSGLVCGGLACVAAGGLTACAPACDAPGPCEVETADCRSPHPGGQLLAGECREGACVAPCATSADCPHDGMDCVGAPGGPACLWAPAYP